MSSRPIPQIHVPETMDIAAVVSVLQPLWMQLPSPEARAAKLASSARGGSRGHLRSGISPTSSPSSPKTGGVGSGSASISDMDVRSLKLLYDGSVNPSSPSPQTSTFTLENFVSRVQALVADDRALVERLIRFAQAHELLKRNAERASKLAAESNAGLETYQKQVRSLDERNAALMKQQTMLRDEIQDLQAMLDRVEAEKRDIEAHAAEQAETCQQLTEVNNSLSAQTLSLAAEAATAPEQGRRVRELETQIVELKTQLVTCQADLETTRKELQQSRDESTAMRQMEQTQQSAMLEELNAMQNENNNLRAQLRSGKK
jgi:chromosome segregation ATPase